MERFEEGKFIDQKSEPQNDARLVQVEGHDQLAGFYQSEQRPLLGEPDPATPWIPGAETTATCRMDGVAGSIRDEFVDGTLAKRKIAFTFVREIEAEDSLLGEVKRRFGGPVMANELMSMKDG